MGLLAPGVSRPARPEPAVDGPGASSSWWPVGSVGHRETGVSPELFMAGLIGALFVGVGAILLVAGRRRGQQPTHRAGD